MNSLIVTLTTDWCSRDYFAARVKGKLYSSLSGIRIVDLSHEQQQGEWGSLRDIIRLGCMSFPSGTIHIIDIGCETTTRKLQVSADGSQHYIPKPVAISYKGQILICSEQRPLRWSIDSSPDVAVALALPSNVQSFGFLAADLFCDVVIGLAKGSSLMDYGNPIEQFTPIPVSMINFNENGFDAKVMYVDNYGNAHLDITFEEFEQLRNNRHFKLDLYVRSGFNTRNDSISSISRHYNDVMMGCLLLMVSYSGHLMIALNGGSAAQLFSLQQNTPCHFSFL